MFEKWMEPFTTFCWMLGAKYPSSLIWRAWEYLLQNHAHDSMACSSTDATYHQVKTRFEWAEELAARFLPKA
jgi:alpha-mannosidase